MSGLEGGAKEAGISRCGAARMCARVHGRNALNKASKTVDNNGTLRYGTAENDHSSSSPPPSDILPNPSGSSRIAALNRSRSSVALMGRCRSLSAKAVKPRPSPPPVELLNELAAAGLPASERVPVPDGAPVPVAEMDEKKWW